MGPDIKAVFLKAKNLRQIMLQQLKKGKNFHFPKSRNSSAFWSGFAC